ncbi:MAG: hypothetical protein WD250_17555 [Egibacteraceae bacterium]
MRGTAPFTALLRRPFVERRLVAYDPAIDSDVCSRPLEVAVRARPVLGATVRALGRRRARGRAAGGGGTDARDAHMAGDRVSG